MNIVLKRLLYFVLINITFINTFFGQTRVVYKKNNYSKDINDTKVSQEKYKDLTPEMVRLLEAHLKSEAMVELELIYDNKASIFKKVEILETDGDEDLIKLQNVLNGDKYYKNLETKEKLYQIEDGKLYDAIVPFDEYSWVITNETKIINGYKCFKATTTKEDMYNPYKKRILTLTPVVWFTPEIPASFGPNGLDGLPGLVLEASMGGNKYLYATKIEFDRKDLKIERPKGDNITEKDLENIIIENYKKTQE